MGVTRKPGWCKTARSVDRKFVALLELYQTNKSTLAKLASCTLFPVQGHGARP